MSKDRTGPLAGLRVVEIAGAGSLALAGMMLADLGAEVIRVEHGAAREPMPRPARFDIALRGRETVTLDLRAEAGRAALLEMLAGADALIEGEGPGGLEALGLGPEACLARNPRLVYGRLSGWGQSGPLAGAPGLDINHVSLVGALHACGRQNEAPTLPFGMIADYAGPSYFLATGVLAALIETLGSGQGQVVDAARVDAVALLMTTYISLYQAGMLTLDRGTNLLDTGSPFYDCYECADGRYVAFGGIERKFYHQLLEELGLDDPALRDQAPGNWARVRAALSATFKTRSRDDWAARLGTTDTCFAPVLDLTEAFAHPQVRARGTYVEVEGVMQPGPNPKFSRTPLTAPMPAGSASAAEALAGWLPEGEIAALVQSGVLA
ncbi:MAG: CoA transferase [Rhodobacteraceae bacterium]|nr:CoA transferase [Paracoccaceae bacterium]